MVKARFKKGDYVRIAPDNDNENYERIRGLELVITHVATKYMPSEEFYGKGRPNGYHPGFDKGSDSALYDVETEGGVELPFSLYEWELKKA